jgi:signal transduction histidine kinase
VRIGAPFSANPTMPDQQNGSVAAPRDLNQVERLFAGGSWPPPGRLRAACAGARERVGERRAGAALDDQHGRREALLFAAEVFGALADQLPSHHAESREIAGGLEALAGVPRLDLAREALRAPDLATLAPSDAGEAQLALLLALAPLRSISLWTLDATGAARCARHLGAGSPSAPMRRLAQALLAGDDPPGAPRGGLIGMRLEGRQSSLGALVGRAEPRAGTRARAFIREALAPLGALVERDMLLARNLADQHTLLEATERRLTRLGFDLHDGPLQDIVMLGEDLRLFREQLGRALDEHGQDRRLEGRLEDLEAQFVALEVALRGIATSAHATVLTNRPFAASVQNLAALFATRTGIEPQVTLEGDLGSISTSQRITLLSVIQEALNNVREHSAARHVEVSVALGPEGVTAQVTDDGRGFDVEKVLVSAASRGRIGLAGMHERVRLLGGACRLESRLGGPTTISITLPRWQPLVDAAPADAAAA